VKSKLEELLAWQIRAAGLPEPTRELRFAPPRRWRLDFAWPEHMLALEVDGGTWTGGRHTRPAGFEADAEKLNTAIVLGWRVLRATGAMVKDGRALQWVEDAMERTNA
jgi:very-short-patch-repair endonuclease